MTIVIYVNFMNWFEKNPRTMIMPNDFFTTPSGGKVIHKNIYSFVPMQDFSEPWTGEKLYAKYGITAEEQAFIESMIRPM